MTTENEITKAWLMYYWRILFYSSIPTRKPIAQRTVVSAEETDIVGDLTDYLEVDVELDLGSENVDIGPETDSFCGIIDETLAQKFESYYQRTGRQKTFFLVAPIRVKNCDGCDYYLFL